MYLNVMHMLYRSSLLVGSISGVVITQCGGRDLLAIVFVV